MGALGGFMGTAGATRSTPRRDALADEGDPITIKRWLLQHEGYRFGAY